MLDKLKILNAFYPSKTCKNKNTNIKHKNITNKENIYNPNSFYVNNYTEVEKHKKRKRYVEKTGHTNEAISCCLLYINLFMFNRFAFAS